MEWVLKWRGSSVRDLLSTRLFRLIGMLSALDQHPYLAFTKPNNDPWDTQVSLQVPKLKYEDTEADSAQIKTACGWGGGTNDSQSSFGIILGGEWSNAVNDCGKWLDGVDSVPAYTTISNCSQWEEWFNWSDDTKAGLLGYAQANMDALQNWFFWTWKIGNSTELGYSPSPFWHYKLGWQNGWIPADPRVAGGYCSRVANVGGSQVGLPLPYRIGQRLMVQFNGSFPASATGAVATPTIDAAQIANHSVWPPTAMGPSFTANQIALFPTLTRTGAPITLAAHTHPANATAVGNGWIDSADTTGAYVTVAGCSYLK